MAEMHQQTSWSMTALQMLWHVLAYVKLSKPGFGAAGGSNEVPEAAGFNERIPAQHQMLRYQPVGKVCKLVQFLKVACDLTAT